MPPHHHSSSSSPMMPSSHHHNHNNISQGSPYNPISLDAAEHAQSQQHAQQSQQEELQSPPPPSIMRTQSATSAEAQRYIRQANRMVAQHLQREAMRRTNSFELSSTTAAAPAVQTTPPSSLPIEPQRSQSMTPNSKLARYSFPSTFHDTPSSQSSWNHPSSTRSAPLDTTTASSEPSSHLHKFQKLRREHTKLKESHQALSLENKQLKSEREELKTKTSQLEARLLESMQARSGREHKFQEEMKRQRASMNSLFTELADSKRETEMLKKQLKDTFTKLQLQQALTANIAFQQEQEELEYQMEQEQFRKQQQLQEQGGALPPTEAVYREDEQHVSNPRDPGFSRLGNFFNRRRQGGPDASGAGTTLASVGHFATYEESKNDLFEQMQDSYGSGSKLFESDTTTTVTTEDSSSNPAHARFLMPSEDDYTIPKTPPTKAKKTSTRRQKTPEEMNYGQTSASMPPAAPMSRLDRIRQKRRNLEAMFRHNGNNNNSSISQDVVPKARRGGRATNHRNNNNLVNLMNHRRHDD